MMRYFERMVRRHMARRDLRGPEDLAVAMRSDGPCPFDASYVRWSFRADGSAQKVDRGYFACLRGALGLTEPETLGLIRAFYFGEGPYPL